MRWLVAPVILAACQVELGQGIDQVDVDDTVPVVVSDPPGAVTIRITPEQTEPGASFGVEIVEDAVDPDGDPVSYKYAWTVDGAPSGITGPDVPAAESVYNELWEVTVTPTDGSSDGPSASASVKVGNRGPTIQNLRFDSYTPNQRLELHFEPPVDPDGDEVISGVVWYDDGFEVPEAANRIGLEAARVLYNHTIRAVVTVSDGFNPPFVAEAITRVRYDCDHLPGAALDDTTLSTARGYHGLAFDDDGTIIGYDGRNALAKALYRGRSGVFVPGMSGIQQLDRLPDRDFVVGDSNAQRLLRVTSAGGSSTLASNVGSVYGVTVGPDGMIYSADQGVRRTDPDTGRTEFVIAAGWGGDAHSVNFSLDSTRMYIGTISTGSIHYVDLDADLNPTGPPQVFVGGLSSYLDGIEIDECGNLYVACYGNSAFYRIELDRTVTSLVTQNAQLYGHGAMYGSGVGGWRDDAIYQPQPYNGNTVREVVIGLLSGDTVRTWNGAPAPW